ncbi:MAG: diaminopimelate decarboxylase, partial [Thermodesulfobacteriota bacterium]
AYRDGRLFAEDIPLEKIAQEVGTPFYCYSHATLARHFQAFKAALEGVSHLICFSVKSNSNLAVLNVFLNQGAGLDVVSGGELYRALKAGADPKKIVFAGVGKTVREMEEALRAGILLFNVESEQELLALDRVAGLGRMKAPVALRINPDINPQTHPYISTGLRQNKFGIPFDKSVDVYRQARALKYIDPIGVHCHIGSQILEVQPFVDTLGRIKELVMKLKEESITVKYLDLGGGLGITYGDEVAPPPSEYVEALLRELGDLDCTLIFEPGRVLVGNAGIMVTRVLYMKRGPEKSFIVVDAGMNDCIRPSLYGAYQAVWPVAQREGEKISGDVVGPICESGDFLAKDRLLPPLEPGDLLAVMSAGAYGFTMASNYNSRPRAAEVLVKGTEQWVVRDRETYEDIVRGESVPEALSGADAGDGR